MAAIVAIVYALVIGESVISTHQIWQHPLTAMNRTVVLATVVVFVGAGWDFLDYSLNIGRFPYKVRWLPDEVGVNKPKTGTEEIRFAIDLLVAVGFAGLLVLSDPLSNPASQNLFRFLAVLVAIDCLSLLSDVLANHRWELPGYRLWLDVPIVSGSVLVAYLICWAVVPGARHSGLNQLFLLILLLAIVTREITARSLAKRFFSEDRAPQQAPIGSNAFKVYLAGPSGFSDPGLLYHKTVLRPLLIEAGFEVLDPWEIQNLDVQRVLSLPLGPERADQLPEVNRKLGRANQDLIDQAGALLALLDGSDIDSGTAAEVGYAAAKATPIVGLRTDRRPSGDNEATDVNLQVQWFIEFSEGQLVFSLGDAVNKLKELTVR
ncbi:MAG TPA: nucleoside 2-deoxyribosyltransferase [Acidimicrobiales bacterium]